MAATPVSVSDISSTSTVPNDWTLYRSNRRGGSCEIDPKRYEKVKANVDTLWKKTKGAVESWHADASDIRIDLTGRIRFKAGGQDHCIDRQVLGENPDQKKELLKEIKKLGAMLANELGEEIDTETNPSINTIAAASSRWDSLRDVASYEEFKKTPLGLKFTEKFSARPNWDQIESRLEQTDQFIANRRDKVQEKIDEKKEEIKSEKNKKKKAELEQELKNLREIRTELDGLKGPQRIAMYWAIAESLTETPDEELPPNKQLKTEDLPRLKTAVSQDLQEALSQTLPVKDTRSLPMQKLGFKKPEPDPEQRVDTSITYFAQDAAELLSNGRSTAHFVVQNMIRLTEEHDDEISKTCRHIGFGEALREDLENARGIARANDTMATNRTKHDKVEKFKEEVLANHETMQTTISDLAEQDLPAAFDDLSKRAHDWVEDERVQARKLSIPAEKTSRLEYLKKAEEQQNEQIRKYRETSDLEEKREALKELLGLLHYEFTL